MKVGILNRINKLNGTGGSFKTKILTPGTLTATVFSNSQIDLSWLDFAINEDGYKVERSADGSTGWTVIATLATNVTSYSDNTGLSDGTQYFYRVRAYKGTYYSDYSNIANAHTALGAPSGLTLTVISDTVLQVFFSSTSTNQDGYRAYIGTNGTTFTSSQTNAATTFNLTGLTANTLYYIKVVSYKGLIESISSDIAIAITYHSEIGTYINGLTTPLSTTQKLNLNQFVDDMAKGLGITHLSDVFDIFYVLAGETAESSLRNLVSASNTATLAGTPNPAFAAFQGFTGDGSHGYINTNYNLSSNSSKYTQNNCSLGAYSRTDKNEGTVDIGCWHSNTCNASITPRATGSNYSTLNTASTTYVSGTVANTLGWSMVSRNGNANTNQLVYFNKTSIIGRTGSGTTNAMANLNVFIGARNDDGTPSSFSTREIAFAFAGAYLTTTMRDTINDVCNNYLSLQGKCPIIAGLIGHYDFLDVATTTKDADGYISQKNDKSLLGRNLLQATVGYQPFYSTFGTYFDGLTQILTTAQHTANTGAESVYLVMLQPNNYANGKLFMGSYTLNKRALYQSLGNNILYSGGYDCSNAVNIFNFQIHKIVFNGASSSYRINNGVAATGNPGTQTADGVSYGLSSVSMPVILLESIHRLSDDTLLESVYNQLYTKYYNILTRVNPRQTFLSMGMGIGLGWDSGTYYANAPIGDKDLSFFAPTSFPDISGWMNTAALSGAGYVQVTAKSEDGFCMYKTSFHETGYDPYSVEYTPWGIANGKPDFLALNIAAARAKNLKIQAYFSMRDLTHEIRTGTDETTDAAAYITMIKAQLTEILAYDIDGLWIDDWSWHISYANIPFAPIYTHIKSIKPNVLIHTNDHAHPGYQTEVEVYEYGVDTLAPENIRISEMAEPIRIDSHWQWVVTDDQTSTALKSKTTLLSEKANYIAASCNFLIASLIDTAGKMTTACKSVLESLGT